MSKFFRWFSANKQSETHNVPSFSAKKLQLQVVLPNKQKLICKNYKLIKVTQAVIIMSHNHSFCGFRLFEK